MKRYNITAEHTNGKSVGHPCTTGVYSDPVDSFEMEWETDDATGTPSYDLEEAAERAGWAALLRIADDAEPCKCRRHLSPGGNAWVNSVSIIVKEIKC